MIADNREATSMPKSAACLLEGRSCFLDHLIPYCHLFNMPLISDDRALLALAEALYPQIPLIHTEQPSELLDRLELLFYAQPYAAFPRGFHLPNLFYPHKIRSCLTLHGNSEKYLEDFWLERFIDEDIILLYGDLLVDLLKKKGVYHRLKNPIISGNVRYQFYLAHKPFFRKKIKLFLPDKKVRKRLLWAPTWERGGKSNFCRHAKVILAKLPQDYQLIIKPHPLMPKEIPLQESENVVLLQDMPLIYPLLDEVDCFLGDSSSVAYDFLTFNRPLYFLPSASCQIHSLGRVISDDEIETLFQIMDQKEEPSLSYARERWGNYAFSHKPLHELQKEVYEKTH